MELYEYIIDTNEKRYEELTEESIFSTELFSKEEFEEIVEKAIENAKSEKNIEKVDWCSVYMMILKYDNRFFVPKTKYIAIVKDDGNLERVI